MYVSALSLVTERKDGSLSGSASCADISILAAGKWQIGSGEGEEKYYGVCVGMKSRLGRRRKRKI